MPVSDQQGKDDFDAEPAGAGLDDVLPGGLDASSLAADWSVPWSDLMMVMFVLFVVLYVTQAAEREIHEAPIPAPPVDRPAATQSVLEQSRRAARETDLANVNVVLMSDRSVRLSVTGPTFFELGSAELRPQMRDFLDRVAQVLQRTPRRVLVAGHTDTFPISSDRFPTNWELSAVRATTVVRYLIRRGGLDAARFEVQAHSMYRPAGPNDSPENKAANRRVEIVILAEHS